MNFIWIQISFGAPIGKKTVINLDETVRTVVYIHRYILFSSSASVTYYCTPKLIRFCTRSAGLCVLCAIQVYCRCQFSGWCTCIMLLIDSRRHWLLFVQPFIGKYPSILWTWRSLKPAAHIFWSMHWIDQYIWSESLSQEYAVDSDTIWNTLLLPYCITTETTAETCILSTFNFLCRCYFWSNEFWKRKYNLNFHISARVNDMGK